MHTRLINTYLITMGMAALHGDDGFYEGVIGKGPARTDYDSPQWKARAKAIADAEAAITPEQRAERQRQNNQRTNLTKRERQALRKGKR